MLLRRENWHMHSVLKLWESLLNDTKQHSKYHQVASDVCSKYVAERFDDIIDDIKRIFVKVTLKKKLTTLMCLVPGRKLLNQETNVTSAMYSVCALRKH